MNVKEISPQTTPLWLFLLIAALLTTTSLMVLAYWKTLRGWWHFYFSSSVIDYMSRRERWRELPPDIGLAVLKVRRFLILTTRQLLRGENGSDNATAETQST